MISDCRIIKEVLIRELELSESKAEEILIKILNETGWKDDR